MSDLPRAEATARAADLVVTLTWMWPEALVIVVGEVDHFTVGMLSRRLTEAVSAGADKVTLDASGISFLGAAGIRSLATAARSLRERGGDLVVLDARPALQRVLVLLGLDGRMTLLEGYR